MGTMRDGVLDVVAQLGKSLIVAIGLEDGIVAETFCPTLLTGEGTVDRALEQTHLGLRFALLYQGDDRTEACIAVVLAFELAEQLVHIGLTVVSVPSA